jgi:uncharacterized protein (UPF0332 family)
MDTKNKEILVKNRIEQAYQTIKDIEILIKNNLLNISINRIYYGMFYMLAALAIKQDFKSSKHRQLLGWFNKSFIKTGIIDKRFGQIINDAFENRSEADYGFLHHYSTQEIEKMFGDMRDFIIEIDNFLKKK